MEEQQIILTPIDSLFHYEAKGLLNSVALGHMPRLIGSQFTMKKLTLLLFALGAGLSFDANAWFFFFIPGSVMSSVSDAITGAEGSNCVGEHAKVGDLVRMPNGDLMRIKSLSGSSVRCIDTKLPIRASLEPSEIAANSNSQASTNASPSAPVATQARLDLPEAWVQQPLTDSLKAGRNVLFTVNRTTDSALLLATVSRQGIADIESYAKTRSAFVASRLDDAVISPPLKMVINGAIAWQSVVSGKARPGLPVPAGVSVTGLNTVYEGKAEIVILNSWTTTPNYENQKDELQRIVHSMTGIVDAPEETASPVAVSRAGPSASENRAQSTPAVNQPDVAQKLTTLKSLLDRGLISKQDYETKKQEILKSF